MESTTTFLEKGKQGDLVYASCLKSMKDSGWMPAYRIGKLGQQQERVKGLGEGAVYLMNILCVSGTLDLSTLIFAFSLSGQSFISTGSDVTHRLTQLFV